MAAAYDIAILGATAAGLAAGYWLARRGRKVVVVNAPRRDAECPLADWVPGDFFRTGGLPVSLGRKCGAGEFRRVCYYSADLSQFAEHRGRRLAGYFVQPGHLVGALKASAARTGVKIRSSRTPPRIQLQEEMVRLTGGVQLQARLLIITHGSPVEAVGDLFMPVHGVRPSPLIVAGLEVPLHRRDAEKLPRALHIVEMPERTEIGMFFPAGRAMHVRVISFSLAAGNRAAELSLLVSKLQQAGILPSNVPLGRARGAVWHPPAGIIAETEAHVAKRCLLAGTAGGFADAVTGQTIAPSVRSALIAARTADAALRSDNTQAALSRYKTAWREELGDYLRPMSTSLQMLLPLLFINKRLVARLTDAVLFGKNI